MVSEWKLKTTDNWNATFMGNSRDAPKLSNGIQPCLKFHAKGMCYKDCAFHGTHKRLEGADYAKTNDFIKQVKADS